ncbi:MAG: hypothetical protein HY578_10470 [Nitrospinae bacterium]|nr:hypothetical protein [Nitrospinota bacterium]
MKKVVLVIFIISIELCNIVGAIDENDLFQKREKELKEIGAHIRGAVLQHDVEKILKYIANDGIPCNDSIIPLNKVRKDLKDRNSWLYCYLFSAKKFEKIYKDVLYPMGLERFFREASDVQIDVSFMEIKGKKKSNYGCIRYKATNIEYAPEFCFFFENGKWTFTDSLYNCN